MRLEDLSGKRFGRLVAIKISGRKNNRVFWECKCDCGKHCEVQAGGLKSGNSQSCSCLKYERIKASIKTHGLSWKIPEYNTWVCIHQRCKNKNNTAFKNYGGRGIKVCKRWDSFEKFLIDMGSRPSSKHSIDRIDNNSGYRPSNCRWANDLEQGSNRRNNRILTLGSKSMTTSQWERFLNLPKGTVSGRLHIGWSVEKALTPKLLRKYK